MSRMSTKATALLLLALSACRAEPAPSQFPKADRPVAPIVSDRFSTEDARDRVGEAEEVMRLAAVSAGMSVADIGAGEGYYTVRLSPIVGSQGRVLAQDIVPETRDRLAQRVQREGLDNVSVRLGEPADPRIPASSFDRIFLVHMYHEVTEPYEFLWNLRDGLKPDGRIVVVDADRPVKRHGMPLPMLRCELEAVGLTLDSSARLTGSDAYFASFRITRARPEPSAMRPCPTQGTDEQGPSGPA
jgi:SAM-dependent methyltransferase